MSPAARQLLIVDDETPARERLTRLVEDIPGWTVAASCATGVEALERVRALDPAVVLLDIRMPGMSGIEVARHLSALDKPPAVIFTTAYDEYALEAFDSRAVGYLLKPVRKRRLVDALTQAGRLNDGLLRQLGQDGFSERKHIAVRQRDDLQLIPVQDIRCFRADQKYVTVQHAGGEALIEESLKNLEEEFGRDFVRIHRSALVALAHVDAIERSTDGSWQVRLKATDERLSVSRRQVSELKSRLTARR